MAVAQDLPSAREPRAVPALRELRGLGRLRQQARHADQQPGADPGPLRVDLPGDEGGGGRDRGPALLRAQRRRLPGHRPGRLAGHHLRLGGAGRLDDHPAVRQERARRAGQPHGVREAPRGGARLPPRAPVAQGQDPDRVPERDLLRRGRDRDRGRREDVLRLQPPRLRRRAADPCACAHLLPVGGGDARRDHLLAERLLAPQLPPDRDRAPQPGAPEHGRPGLHNPGRVHHATASSRSRSRTRSARRPRTRRRLTSRPGCASSSSTATAPARRSAADCRSSRRSTWSCSSRSRASSARRSAAIPRRPRSSCSTTRRPTSWRWSADRLPGGAVQPRHQRAPPAGFGVQAVHAR